MGRDKAGVVFEGQPLWERQLATLRQLAPAELFISGKANGPYAGAGVEILLDITPDCGPLSGLEAALQRFSQSLVLVLAVDLPAMTAEFLASLVRTGNGSGAGAVPRLDGWFEPLAAVYPRTCLPLVQERLKTADFSMQSFVREAVARRLVNPVEIPAEVGALFRNVNTASDLEEKGVI